MRNTCVKSVNIIDVSNANENKCEQSEHLATKQCTTNVNKESKHLVHQSLKTQTNHQRNKHNQPNVNHQTQIVEKHLNAIIVRENASAKVPPNSKTTATSITAIVPSRETLSAKNANVRSGAQVI